MTEYKLTCSFFRCVPKTKAIRKASRQVAYKYSTQNVGLRVGYINVSFVPDRLPQINFILRTNEVVFNSLIVQFQITLIRDALHFS